MGKSRRFGKLRAGTARQDNSSIHEVAGNLAFTVVAARRGIMVAARSGAGAAGS